MQNELLTRAEQYQKKHKRRKVWQRIVGGLACVVVFCTSYALILPAITMEQAAYCGMEEHEHTEACYEKQLICGYDEAAEAGSDLTTVGHVHEDSCYEEQQILICGLEEPAGHVHNESCIQSERSLSCTEAHEHTDACYETVETYGCGMAEGQGGHMHGPECYETRMALICELPESGISKFGAAEELHVHTDDCYEDVLVCQEEEHTHVLACYSNPKADLESASVWEKSVSGVELTGVWADDVIAVAESQLGYRESTANYIVMEDGETTKGITRYGQWYGDPYGDWCAMFVSFCLNYAAIPETAIPYDEGCQRWIETLAKPEWALYREAGTYVPVKGDIVFFDNDDDGSSDHVGLVQNVEEEMLTVVEGNSANRVRVKEYQWNDACIMGYGTLPENPDFLAPEENPDAQVRSLTAAVYRDDTCQEPLDDAAAITVTGAFPEGAEALAFPVTVETDMQVLCAYDISVRLPDGSPFVPSADAPVTVSIRAPEFAAMEEGFGIAVYRAAMAGEPEYVESEQTNDEVRFEADRLCAYMVAAVPTDDIPEKPTTIAMSDDFVYENDRFSLVLHVEGSAYLQDATAEPANEPAAVAEAEQETEPAPQDVMAAQDQPQDAAVVAAEEAVSEAGDGSGSDEPAETEAPVLVVHELNEQQTEYQQVASAFEEGYSDGLLDLSVLSLEFSYQGAALDVSSCSITAQVTPLARMMETARAACAELETDAAPEAETGVVFAIAEATEDGTEELDSAVVDASTREAPVLTASVGSNAMLAVAAAQTANPQFTVQYYAWLDVAADSGSSTDNLPVIDTSGRKLPQNGTTPTTKTLYLEETSSGSGVYGIKTTSTLTQVYSSHEYQYITAPNLTYFNRLYENGHYAIQEIWILQAGKDANSVERADWIVYDPATTHFTNRSQSVNDNTVLITDGTVIRLVFDTTDSIYTNAVSFYDYDITNDGVHTAAQGINSASNYSGSGTKLAFGNNNTDTGLAGETWNGNTLNKANSNGYSGCTFGLASGLSDGKIQYASGVDAPNLFNDGTATGKISYDSGQYTLSFAREGDTYTLSSVGGTISATSLQTFTSRWNWNNTRKIWSNHFWPMDNVTNTDPHTGVPGNTGTYIGASGTTKSYPESDNGIAHNNMFGMNYQVQFKLTEDYIGPLEYYFFGDDDMWVFLDGTLVCDIGGVHSSVGEYVNLWDYITKGSAGTHTLSFFYTERGLSGSTCYMQFTLPSVSSITPEQNTGMLTVQKKVVGAVDSEEVFHFDIMFTDASGKPLPDDYSYTRYTAEGTVVKQDVIIYDGGSFELKAGEYVIINYLPYGTQYAITETNVPYYTVSYQVNGGTPTEGDTATGQIPTGGSGSVVYTNTAMPVLPSTGGSGTKPYAIGGLLLTTAALLLLYINKKRRKEDHTPS